MSGRPTYEELEKRVKALEKYEFERNQADQTYLEDEEKYKNLYNVTFEAIFLSDQGLCIGQNKSAERIFGYTYKEAIGRKGIDWIHPEYHSIVKQNIFSGYEKPYEAVAIRKNGSTFPCEIQACMTFQNGRSIRVTALRDIIERKNAEKVIAEKERFLNVLLNAMPIPVFYKDREGIYQGFNEAYEAFMGKSKDQLIGKSVFDISPKELAQIYYAKDNELFDSGGSQHYELKVKSNTGVLRDVIFDKSAYTDDKGKVIGLIGTVQDITERKQNEKALLESEKKYRSVVENANESITVTQDGALKFVNPKALEISGYSEAELMSIPFIEIVHPDDRQVVMQRNLERLNTQKTIGAYELRILTKNGSIKWLESRADIINWEGKTATLNILTDITDRKHSETLLQARECQLRFITDHAPVMIAHCDQKQIYKFVNQQYAEIFGLKAIDVVGKHIREVLGKETYEKALPHIETALVGQISEYDLLLPMKPDGLITVHVSYVPESDEYGRVVGFIAAMTDITERKQMEGALEKSHEILEEKVKEKTAALEDMNAALRVMLNKRDEDAQAVEEKIFCNYESMILPFFDKLKNSYSNKNQMILIDIIETNLKDIISPFSKKLSDPMINLTPKEIQIASFIKQGITTKEIAQSLNCSVRTIDGHRDNIRIKLKIKNKKINLRTFLMTL